MIDFPASILTAEEWPTTELTEMDHLYNAVMISLFSDQRVGDVPPHEPTHRGYWADSLEPKDAPVGSKLWTLANAPLNAEALDDAIQYAEEALTWMVPDYASTVHIDGALSKGTIQLFIEIATTKGVFNFKSDLQKGTVWTSDPPYRN